MYSVRLELDLTSLYLRLFFRARPYSAPQLDSLAETMGVVQLMSSSPLERYLISDSTSVAALSLGNKIMFGRSYYQKLSEEERLAVSAHELAHIKEQHNRRLMVALVALVSSVAFATTTLLALHSVLVTESVFCISFLGVVRVLSSREAERSRLEELRCDSAAASLIGGQHMISSIRLAESMFVRKPRRGLRGWFSTKLNGGAEERISALVALSSK